LIEESQLNIRLDRIQACREIRGSFKQNLERHVIKLFDQKAKVVMTNMDLKNMDSNARYYGNYLIKHENELISILINEIIRSIDAIEEEKRCT